MINKKIIYWQKTLTPYFLRKSLKNDQISITSTDTVLGFIGQLTLKSFEKLNSIKEDRTDKPYLIVISSQDKLKNFVQIENIDKNIEHFISQCWPGPVTLIFKANQQLPAFLTSATGTIALRCPNHKPLRTVLSSFDGLFSTSANKSGKPIPTNIEEIDHTIIEKIDYLVIDKDIQSNKVVSSTILDLSSPDGTIQVVREGAYPVKELEKLYGSSFKK